MKCSVFNNSIIFIIIFFVVVGASATDFTYGWDIAITNMNAGPVQLYPTCMLVGASLTDMTAG